MDYGLQDFRLVYLMAKHAQEKQKLVEKNPLVFGIFRFEKNDCLS